MSTPLMKQYAQVKARYPGTILLFRMGDFFETFEEDAQITSRVLGITLTRRGNGAAGEVPLAGFPHHALESYLPKLLRAGYRVAVCEQLEDPRFAKGIVKRDVVEVVTPGVAFSDRVLERSQNNYLAAVALPSAIAPLDATVGVAFADVSTGEFRTAEITLRELRDQISTIGPSELIVQERDENTLKSLLAGLFHGLYTRLDNWVFSLEYGSEILVHQFKTQSLKGFGLEGASWGIVAAGAVMHYLRETQKANLPHITRIVPYEIGTTMVLDPSTKRNLEITSSIAGSERGTLFSVLDRTETAMGARLLKRWVNLPLKSPAAIVRRLDAVEELVRNGPLRSRIRDILHRFGDLERLNARICTGRATPRDVRALHAMLREVESLRESLAGCSSAEVAALRGSLDPLPDICALIDAAVNPDPPAALSDGGVIRSGYHAGLDELRGIASGGKRWIAELQAAERARTGIGSLKVGYNSVFGYYIEITHTHREKVPDGYLRKQTLTNAERYITPALKEHEEKILHAEEKILALETELFQGVRLAIADHAATVSTDATSVATLDCYCSLSTVGAEYRYVRPDVGDSTLLEITGGRHPVIERLLPPGEEYIPNDVRVDTDRDQILIITGPNMSGKSSYLRQTGLIVLLAQIGSFVPAERAAVGVVDRIFTRVGASDNITSGESTFLVEMHEAAQIVNTATERSLILLDEVGRGTSTFDGISIAWALTEYLHESVRARTLFATHYHELNELADLFDRIRNLKVDVREYGDRVIFLHKVTPGSADHSYGIHVAKMAGLPASVTERAGQILANLEGTELTVHGEGSSHGQGRMRSSGVQLTLFEMRDDPLREELRRLDIDTLTPLEALKKLSALKDSVTKQ
jgi:DNA mismatch repair protein MutS